MNQEEIIKEQTGRGKYIFENMKNKDMKKCLV